MISPAFVLMSLSVCVNLVSKPLIALALAATPVVPLFTVDCKSDMLLALVDIFPVLVATVPVSNVFMALESADKPVVESFIADCIDDISPAFVAMSPVLVATVPVSSVFMALESADRPVVELVIAAFMEVISLVFVLVALSVLLTLVVNCDKAAAVADTPVELSFTVVSKSDIAVAWLALAEFIVIIEP